MFGDGESCLYPAEQSSCRIHNLWAFNIFVVKSVLWCNSSETEIFITVIV